MDISNYCFHNKLNNKYDASIFELKIFINSAKFKHFIEYDHIEIKKEPLLREMKLYMK
jgi:hypothetical protein